MSQGVNRVILLGNVGKDPEVRYTQAGAAVVTFSLATTESHKNTEGHREDRTEWHRIVAFGRTAELCGQYLSKGRMVFLEGKIQSRSYDDKDGNKRYVTEIVANSVQFIGPRDGVNGAPKTESHDAMGYGQAELSVQGQGKKDYPQPPEARGAPSQGSRWDANQTDDIPF